MHMLEYVSGCTPRPVTATTKTVSHFYYTSSLVIASGLGAHPNVAFKQSNTRSNHVQWHNTSFQLLNWKEDTKPSCLSNNLDLAPVKYTQHQLQSSTQHPSA